MDSLRRGHRPRFAKFDHDAECWRKIVSEHAALSPGQGAARPHHRGPGDAVAAIFEALGIKKTAEGVICPSGKKLSGCGCAKFRAKMNELGWAGCITNMPEIVKWFAAKARDCGLGVNTASLMLLAGSTLARLKEKYAGE